MSPNWIDLDGVVNMRDLGGLPTRDGRTTASRVLIRSDNLQQLSAADIAHLVSAIGLRDIVDLRSNTEVHIEGPGPLLEVESLTHHHHSLFTDDREVSAGDALPWQSLEADRTSAEFWSRHYLGYLLNRPDSVSAALRVVADSEGATIVHCAAGKDRTGTVIGLALDVAGVEHDLIADDFMVSAERIDAIIARLADRPAYAEHLAGQQVAEQVPRREAIEAILRHVREEFGGAGGWLRSQGWTSQAVYRLRERLLG